MSPVTRDQAELAKAVRKTQKSSADDADRGCVYEGLCALCATCERRFYCMFPTPAVGFWRCEQYQGL